MSLPSNFEPSNFEMSQDPGPMHAARAKEPQFIEENVDGEESKESLVSQQKRVRGDSF